MNDKASEIMALLQQIVDMVDQGDHPFLRSKKVILDEEELVGILEQLRMSIPAEVDKANKVLADRDNILSKAHTEAQNLVAEAQEQEQKILDGARTKEEIMLRESEISKQAEALAKQLKERSENFAKQIEGEANDYAAQKRLEADTYAQQVKVEADAYARQTKVNALNYSGSCLKYIDGKLRDMNGLINSALSSVTEVRGSLDAELAKQKEPAVEPEQIME